MSAAREKWPGEMAKKLLKKVDAIQVSHATSFAGGHLTTVAIKHV